MRTLSSDGGAHAHRWTPGGTSEALSKKQMRDEIQAFHSFLHDHPKVSTELQANPALAGNKKYLDKHET